MAGDGVSLQTSVLQLGNVAKNQSRSQQASAVPPGQNAAMLKDEVQRLQKVSESEKAEKAGVDPDEERARGRRKKNTAGHDGTDDDVDDENEHDEAVAAGLGGLVDIKA